MPLRPILRPGATHHSELLLVTARDFIGVQTNFEDPHRGINRQTEWTRDVVEWSDEEHDRNGVHDTVRIPRAYIRAGYDGAGNYEITGDSYHAGVYVRDDPSVVKATVVGNGIIDFEFEEALPSGTEWGIIDACEAEQFGVIGVLLNWQPVWVHGDVLSSTVIRIYRRTIEPSPVYGYHGQLAFLVVG